MFRYVARRLLWLIPTLLLVTFLVYVALRLGTNPVASYKRTNPRASKAKVAQYIEVNGLYTGVGGYVRGYFQWLKGFITFDWPRSIKGNVDVFVKLKDALANSLRLGLVATFFGILIGNHQQGDCQSGARFWGATPVAPQLVADLQIPKLLRVQRLADLTLTVQDQPVISGAGLAAAQIYPCP